MAEARSRQNVDPVDLLDVDSLLDDEERLIQSTVRAFVEDKILPEIDTGFAQGGAEASEDTSAIEMTALQHQALNILRKNPWIQNAGGGTNEAPQNNGFLFGTPSRRGNLPEQSSNCPKIS